jgi:DNA-binding CsgD family transcriptional regulator
MRTGPSFLLASLVVRSMDRLRHLPNIVGQLRESVLCGDAIPLSAVSRSIGATYTLLFAERVVDGSVQAPLVDGVDPAYCDRLQRAATERLLPRWLRGLQSGTVADRATLQRDGDFTRSAFFDYVVRPEGRFHCLISTPYVTPAQRFHMIVGRPISSGDFSTSDFQMLHKILPYVGQLIASGLSMAGAERHAGMLSSTLDQLSLNVLLVSRDCRLIFANLGARRLLSMRDGLEVVGSMLAPSDPVMNIALKRTIARTLSQLENEQTILQIERPSGCAPFEVTVLRLEDTGTVVENFATDEKLAMLLIRQSDSRGVVNNATLKRYFGLTGKESDVAAMVARGYSLRLIANMLGISYNTARYHLRHIFEKTNTNRQTDLVRTILDLS